MKTYQEHGLLVKEVAELTGLSRQVIRKWEERYGVICPKRHENGYRLYTSQDVGVLMEICRLRNQGHSMKEALHLLQSQQTPAPAPHMPLSEEVLALLKKGAMYDEAGLFLLLKQAHHRHGLEKFLSSTIQPLMLEIGKLWASGEWDESQETITSLVVRDFLVQIRRNFELAEGSPLMLGCCLPYETHEIPLHIILLQAMLHGWQTIAAGPSPKLSSIEYLVERLQPQKLLLSATTTMPFERNPRLFDQLETIAEKNQSTEFFIGGHGVFDQAVFWKPHRIRIAYSLGEIFDEDGD
ncbi:MerR family transcriptional regulator [Planomicrobium sp. CPCC 101079]|uniref:MerR family transcriptional regulator n=1 Tax=Planomicrobium sp. CPCC 101079 TaxID=2599618 RepID=UPI0011B60C77|nr:MerR family transcriptional regulator [Planomicrobium sp. CPCC 101079]TWT01543.1 MerR family transcriptional regulator [Planomicrobium sp. CPCC 101079]